jgi:quinol monooxygenase YgiN
VKVETMYARIGFANVRPGQLDKATTILENQGIPVLLSLPGSVAVQFYRNREASTAVLLSHWRTREAAEAVAQNRDYENFVLRLQHTIDGDIQVGIFELVGG